MSDLEAVGQKRAKAVAPRRRRAPMKAAELFFDRELSWLEFNARVLAEANRPENPLLERLRFLAIFSNNLDEFFMIYVSGMRERPDLTTGKPPSERAFLARLSAIKERLEPMLAAQYRGLQELIPQLAPHGVCLMRYDELMEEDRDHLAGYFESEVFPVLTPLAVDPGHPFPYISNLSLSLAVVVHDPVTGLDRFARIKVPEPPVLPRLVPLPGELWRFVLLEEVISAHLLRLFPGMEPRAAYAFRVTRDADLELQENAATDLLEFIEDELPKRRFGEIERLELSPDMPETIRETVIAELGAIPEQVYTLNGPLHPGDLLPLADIDLPELRFPPFTPGLPAALRTGSDLFAAIRQGDILLHHPYQSFECVIDFLSAAASDPNVLTIKHTLYRTSGDSPIHHKLIEAAENGKQVACLVELKARFDEANNINWARQLEKSGVHVVYGLLGLKTHCKVTLVVRREESGLRRYLHIGTGNYNPKTARVYTDLGLLTCEPDFGVDATDLFNYLTGYSRQTEYRKFLVAPVTLRSRLEELVAREAKGQTPDRPGRIIAKMNALVDPALIRALYTASQAGVQVDLIVRGMCCLRPGVPGLSDNIRVVSIVGRFLEHSRIFYFQNNGAEEIYIGSADWMSRNLDRRVEVVIPILSEANRRQLLDEMLLVLLEDNTQAWELRSDGCYQRRHPTPGRHHCCAQTMLLHQMAQE